MNASATIRSAYVRASVMNLRPPGMQPTGVLSSRPANDDKLRHFTPVNHLEHRENCEKERWHGTVSPDVVSFMDFDDDSEPFLPRFRKMYTVFPYRDPIYLVAIVFALGSLDLVLNAFFDLLPRVAPATKFAAEEPVAVPATVLIGSILFFAAGIFDTFGALNADRGTLETSMEDMRNVTYKPALLGSPEFSWVPSREKFVDLATTNLAFQAGIIVLFGGVIFMFAGIVDFPGVVPEASPFFALTVFGPQVIHGFLFLVANAMLALSEQERWWRPKVRDADWQGAFLNAVGGFGFMMAGFFLFRKEDVAAAVAAMVGSWAFLVGSVIRWYVVMVFC